MSRTFKIVNGDYVLDRTNGRPTTVTGREKLRQDVNIMLTTETRANSYGAGLEDLIGRDMDPAAFRIEVGRRIRSSTNALQRLQDQFLAAQRTAQERLATIAALSVFVLPGDEKTGVGFRLRVTPVAGDAVALSGAIT